MSNIIVMAFSPRNVVGCLLKEGLQRGVTGTPRTPPPPPLATPLIRSNLFTERKKRHYDNATGSAKIDSLCLYVRQPDRFSKLLRVGQSKIFLDFN